MIKLDAVVRAQNWSIDCLSCLGSTYVHETKHFLKMCGAIELGKIETWGGVVSYVIHGGKADSYVSAWAEHTLVPFLISARVILACSSLPSV